MDTSRLDLLINASKEQISDIPGLTYPNRVETLQSRKAQKIQDLEAKNVGIVRNVIDGDTVLLNDDKTSTRLLDRNAYETPHGNDWLEQKRNQDRMAKQREQLALEKGLPVTNEDVFTQGLQDKKNLQQELAPGSILPKRPILGKYEQIANPNPQDASPQNNYGRNLGIVAPLAGGYTDNKGQQVLPRKEVRKQTPSYGGIEGLQPIDRSPVDLSSAAIKEGSKQYELGQSNLLDTAQYGVGRALAGVGDAIVDTGIALGEEIVKGVNTIQGKYQTPEQINKRLAKSIKGTWLADHIDSSGNFKSLDKYKKAVEYGYDDKNTQEAMKSLGDAWDSKDPMKMGEALISATITAGPEFLLESAGEIALGALGKAGLVLNAGKYTNDILEERKEITGRNATPQEAALIAVAGTAEAYLNKLGVDEMLGRTHLVKGALQTIALYGSETAAKNAIKNIAEKAAMGSGVVAGKAGYEGVEEVLQESLEIVGQKYGTDAQEEILNDKSYRQLFQAFGGGFAGGATAAGIGTIASAKDSVYDTVGTLAKYGESLRKPVEAVQETSYWKPEYDTKLEETIQSGDLQSFAVNVSEVLNSIPETATEEEKNAVKSRLNDYYGAIQQVKAQKAAEYEQGSDYSSTVKGAEPWDTLDILTHITADKKAENFQQELLSDENFINRFDSMEQAEQAINDAVETRKLLRGLEGIAETRGQVAITGIDESRRGFADWFRRARSGDTDARDNLYRFMETHESKADAMSSQRLEMNAETLAEVQGIAKQAGVNEKTALMALLAQNNKVPKEVRQSAKYKQAYERMKSTIGRDKLEFTDKDEYGNYINTYPIKYLSNWGRNEGIFEVNNSDRLVNLVESEADFADLRKDVNPSSLGTVISSIRREVDAMMALTDRLEGKKKERKVQEASKKKEPTGAAAEMKDVSEVRVGESEEDVKKRQEAVRRKGLDSKRKKDTKKDIEEQLAREELETGNELDLIEAEQQAIKERGPRSIEEVEKEADRAPKRPLTKDEQFVQDLRSQIEKQGANEFTSDYMDRINRVLRKASDALKRAKEGTAKYDAIKEVVREAKIALITKREEYAKEVAQVKEEFEKAKKLGKQARKDVNELRQVMEKQGRALEVFKMVARDADTQALIDERNALVKELKSREKGMRTSITIISKFLNSSVVDGKDKTIALEELKKAHESIDAVAYKSEGKGIRNLVKAMTAISKLVAKVSQKMADKIDQFMRKLEDHMIDVRRLKEEIRFIEKEVIATAREKEKLYREMERALEEELGESDPRYSKELLTGGAFGSTALKYSKRRIASREFQMKYGKELAKEIAPQVGESLIEYRERIAKIESNAAIRKEVSNFELGFQYDEGMTTTLGQLLDTKKVNSDFARYDISMVDDAKLQEVLEKSVQILGKMVPSIEEKYQAEWLMKDKARGLVFRNDGSIDKNVVGAMLASVVEELKTGSNYIHMTKEEVARMYGLDEQDMTTNEYKVLSRLGVPAKYMTNTVGKMVMGHLGLRMKEGANSNEFNELVASVGNMSMYLAENLKLVKVNTVRNEELVDIFNVDEKDYDKVGYYVKLSNDIIHGNKALDRVKKFHEVINDKLVITETKKNVRFSKRKFGKEDCNGM